VLLSGAESSVNCCLEGVDHQVVDSDDRNSGRRGLFSSTTNAPENLQTSILCD